MMLQMLENHLVPLSKSRASRSGAVMSGPTAIASAASTGPASIARTVNATLTPVSATPSCGDFTLRSENSHARHKKWVRNQQSCARPLAVSTAIARTSRRRPQQGKGTPNTTLQKCSLQQIGAVSLSRMAMPDII
jgi:hypothetical protein